MASDLIDKYPFLRIQVADGIFAEDDNWLLHVPSGWRDIFIAFCDEILAEYESLPPEDKDSFVFSEVKEKYGSLRVYFFGTRAMHDAEWKLETVSSYTCICCGRRPTAGNKYVIYHSKGYVLPYCRKCARKKIYDKSSPIRYTKNSFTRLTHKMYFLLKETKPDGCTSTRRINLD